MIFFADENIPPKAARILSIFDPKYQVRAYTDYFEQGVPDVEWMQEVASWDDKPVVLGGDGRILTNKAEKQVLKECDLAFVFLKRGWTKLPWTEFAWKIIKAWPEIIKNVEQARYTMVFEVAVNSLKIESNRISHL